MTNAGKTEALLRRFKLGCGSFLIAALTACGAAGDGFFAGVGSGGTGGGSGTSPTTVIGAIRGFGSIIVNGVRFDESVASIVGDEGASLSAGSLRLGMVVQVEGSANPATMTGVASQITVIGALRGPIESISASSGSLVAMGATVSVSVQTIFDGAASLQDLAAGDFIEVHGYFDPALGVIGATRVGRLTSAPAIYKARGIAGALDPVARTLRLGSLIVDYSAATLEGLPAGPQPGDTLSISATSAPGASVWKVDRVQLVRAPVLAESSRASLEGRVANFFGLSSFEVQGVPVDASAAQFSGGSPVALANGLRVEVEGTLSGGVLRASKVEIEDETSQPDQTEVEGRIEAVLGQFSFVVRGVTVDASAATLENGSAANIAVGRRVHAVGPIEGSVLRAERLKFEDD